MSSAYSTLHNYAALPVYTPDVNLVAQGLQFKQQKYDRNKEQLQKAFDEFTMLDVAKDVDQEYVAERIQKAEELVNKYTHLDLSSQGLTQSLMRTMGTIVDENVKNAVLSTRVFKSEQKQWQKAKEESPELYADQNYWYAMQRPNQWLSDGKVGSKYNGGGGFIAYDDVAKRLLDEMPEQIKTIKDEWVELESPSGGRMFYDKVTMEAIPKEEVQTVVDTIIGQKGMQQLQIDASYNFNQLGEERAYSQIESVRNNKVKNLERQISSLNQMPKTGARSKALEYKKQKLNQLKNTPVTGLNPSQLQGIYSSMYIDNFKGGIVDTYSKEPTVIDRDIDKNHLESVKYQERVSKAMKAEQEKQKKELAESTVLPGSIKEIGEDEGYVGKEDALSVIDQNRKTAVEQVNSLGYDFTNNEVAQLAKAWDPSVKPNDNGFINVKIGDKDISINQEDSKTIAALNNLYHKFSPDSPLNKKVTESVSNAMDATKKAIIEEGRTEDMGWLPNILRLEVKDGKLNKGSSVKDSNTYSQLVMRKASGATLTEDEEVTLDMYTSMHQIADPNLSEQEKSLAFDIFRDRVVNKVGLEEFEKLGIQSPEGVGAIFTDMAQLEAQERLVGQLVGGATNPLIGDILGSATGLSMSATAKGGALGSDFYLENDYSLARAKNKNWRAAREKIEKQFESTDLQNTRSSFIVAEGMGGVNFEKLNAYLGKKSSDKEPIEIWRELDEEGMPTGDFRWSYTKRGTSKGEPTKTTVSWENEGETKITAEQAQELGLNFMSVDDTPYDAKRYGEDAQPIDLGSTSYTKGELLKYTQTYNDTPIFWSPEKAQSVITEFTEGLSGEPLKLVMSRIDKYNKGLYEVSIKPESDGFYYINYESEGDNFKSVLRDNSNKPVSKISHLNAITFSRDNSIALKENNFYNIIRDYSTELKREYMVDLMTANPKLR